MDITIFHLTLTDVFLLSSGNGSGSFSVDRYSLHSRAPDSELASSRYNSSSRYSSVTSPDSSRYSSVTSPDSSRYSSVASPDSSRYSSVTSPRSRRSYTASYTPRYVPSSVSSRWAANAQLSDSEEDEEERSYRRKRGEVTRTGERHPQQVRGAHIESLIVR